MRLPEPLDDRVITEGRLYHELNASLCRTIKSKDFLPLDRLEQLVTRDAVREALKAHFPGILSSQLDFCTDYICRRRMVQTHPPRHVKYASRQRLFTILAMCAKLDRLGFFIEAQISDHDLPFIRPRESPGELCSKYDTSKAISCSNGWTYPELNAFDHTQWQVISPYFSKPSKTSGEKATHYQLHPMDILPFIDDNNEGLEQKVVPGGQSQVFKIKIHPAHHNFDLPAVRDARYLKMDSLLIHLSRTGKAILRSRGSGQPIRRSLTKKPTLSRGLASVLIPAS